MMEVTPNEALRHMIECLSLENQYVAFHALDALEAQLAEATEAARLQVALDRIEAAGYLRRGLFCDTIIIAGNQESVLQWCCEIDTQAGEKEFYSKTPAEAAEKAAAWAESQKESNE